MLGTLAIALTVSLFGGIQSASAAAFLWIAAPTWSYSAAACVSVGSFASFWGLSVGRGSFSFAFAGCPGVFGSSGAFAIARAGFGGGGGAFAFGLSDPYAGVGVDVNLADSLNGGSGPGDQTNYGADSSNASSELGSDSFTIGPSGVTFPSETESALNAVDELAIYAIPIAEADYSDNSDICALLGESGCSPGSGPDVTTISALDALLGSPLATEDDPSGPNWNVPLSIPAGDLPILVAEGDAVPEPASILLFGQAILGLGLIATWQRRRRC
jgi:hypothetical protein